MIDLQSDPVPVKPILHRAVLLPLILMSALAAILVWQINHLLAVTRWVDHTDQVISRAHESYRLLADQQARFRGFLLLGTPDSLDAYIQAETRLDPSLATLGMMVRDNPPQLSRVAQIRSIAAAWLQFARSTVEVRRRGGDHRAMMLTGRGRRTTDEARALLGTVIQAEEELRQQRVRAATMTVNVVLGTAVGLTLLLALVLALVTSRQISYLAASYRTVIQERQHSADLFQRFMQYNPALAFVRDGEGRILYANAAYERFFGATLEQLSGSTLTAVVPETTADELRKLYQRVVTENQPLETQQTIPDPQGRPHECMFYLFPIPHAEDGQLLGGLALDVTEHKQLEEQLRQSQKMDAIGQLAGGIAHDFNNMLAVICGYTSILLDRVPLGDPMREPLEEVQTAGERAIVLTRQLLAFSRKQVLAPKLLDLHEVVSGVSQLLGRLIGEDIDLVTRYCPEPSPVIADPSQLEQVLMNLAVNARDAMPRGGKLTIEVQNVELDEAYVREHFDVKPGPYVLLAVSDNGCGMDRETQARLFEPFFTTKGVGKGTGLGLATVYGIVRQSGADIRVYSEPEHGTTFKIYFPRAVEADARPVSAPEKGVVLAGTETILLVEDEPSVRQLVRIGLEEYGYVVLTAGSAEEMLRRCSEHSEPIHLLLTDVVMPESSGRELAERVMAQRADMKVLFMSGYTDDAVVRHGVLHAEANFIQKPFTPAALARKVREVLDA